MEHTDVKQRPLRTRAELEAIISSQIALGVISSVEDGIEKGDPDVIEYGALSLSDDLRCDIANKKDLPENIVKHLLKDRDTSIRWRVASIYWNTLEAAEITKLENEAHRTIQNMKNIKYGDDRLKIKDHYETILHNLYRQKDRITAADADKELVRIFENIKFNEHQEPWPDFITREPFRLRELPLLNTLLHDEGFYKDNNIFSRSIVHPDEDVRLDLLIRIVKWKTSDFRNTFNYLINFVHANANYPFKTVDGRKTTDKQWVFRFLASDESKKVRKTLVKHISERSVLKYIADNDTTPTIKFTALTKYNHFTRRAAYAVKYHAKKDKR